MMDARFERVRPTGAREIWRCALQRPRKFSRGAHEPFFENCNLKHLIYMLQKCQIFVSFIKEKHYFEIFWKKKIFFLTLQGRNKILHPLSGPHREQNFAGNLNRMYQSNPPEHCKKNYFIISSSKKTIFQLQKRKNIGDFNFVIHD